MNEPGWSDSTRDLTRERIAEGRLGFVPLGDLLHMKHHDGRFGTMAIEDLMAGVLRVIDRDSGEASVYAGEEELLRDGWAVD